MANLDLNTFILPAITASALLHRFRGQRDSFQVPNPGEKFHEKRQVSRPEMFPRCRKPASEGAFYSRKMTCGLHLPQGGCTRKDTYLDFAMGAFSSKPRCEEGGWIEVMLKVANYLGGGDGSGLVDRYAPIGLEKGKRHEGRKPYQRHPQSFCPLGWT